MDAEYFDLDQLNGKTVKKKIGEQLIDIAWNEVYTDATYFMVFFGAKWCESSTKLAPILAQFYRTMKCRDENVEILYVSSDRTRQEMEEFVLESHGDWFVIYEEDDRSNNLVRLMRDYFSCNTIPMLGVKVQGVWSDDQTIADILTHKYLTLKHWDKKFEKLSNANDGFAFPEAEEEDKFVDASANPSIGISEDETGDAINKLVQDNIGIETGCCKLPKLPSNVKLDPNEILANVALIRRVGKKLRKEMPVKAFKNPEIVGFYFASYSCPASRNFTLVLRDLYENLKSKNEQFEIVFVSRDDSEEEMKQNLLLDHGDWLAVPFDEEFIGRLHTTFGVESSPALVIVKKSGEMISEDGRTDLEVKGLRAYDSWKEGHAALSQNEADKYWEKKNPRYELNPPASIFSKTSLLRKRDGELYEVSGLDSLIHINIVGFFFASSNRHMCRQVLPMLKELYTQVKAENEPFEIIFISKDNSEEEMKEYFLSEHGDWLAVPFDPELIQHLSRMFSVQDVPSMPIVDKQGKLIDINGSMDVLVKGPEVYYTWKHGRVAYTVDDVAQYWLEKW